MEETGTSGAQIRQSSLLRTIFQLNRYRLVLAFHKKSAISDQHEIDACTCHEIGREFGNAASGKASAKVLGRMVRR